MQINPFHYVNNEKYVHYDPAKWPMMSGASTSPEAEILGKLPTDSGMVPSREGLTCDGEVKQWLSG